MPSKSYPASTAYDQKVASTYEADRVIEPLWEREQQLVKNYVATIPANSIVLDLPVGTGRFFEYYEARNLQVIGIDISENMIREARNKIRDSSAWKSRVSLRSGDVTNLELPANSVDVVISWRLFHLLPRPVLLKGIAELTRVTKKEILVQTYQTRQINPLELLIRKTWSVIKKSIKPRSRGGSNAEEPWRHIQSFSHPEAVIVNEFLKNGFHLREKNVFDQYKGDPVNAYFFEKRI